MTPSDDSRSYGTYEKNMDGFSDDYSNYEVSCIHCCIVDKLYNYIQSITDILIKLFVSFVFKLHEKN